MTRIQELVFFSPTEQLTIDDVEIHLEASSTADVGQAADVQVRCGNDTCVLPRFAATQPTPVYSRQTENLPMILAVTFGGGARIVVLVGESSVVAVDAHGCRSREIARLRGRRDEYDPGFRHERIIETNEGVLLIYERGVLHIGMDGLVRWECELYADDIFERRDSHHLYYWSEAQGEFCIDISNGLKRRCHHG